MIVWHSCLIEVNKYKANGSEVILLLWGMLTVHKTSGLRWLWIDANNVPRL